jgi:hypothetical protein
VLLVKTSKKKSTLVGVKNYTKLCVNIVDSSMFAVVGFGGHGGEAPMQAALLGGVFV